jgi:tryptophanyl-tRNA synthetase
MGTSIILTGLRANGEFHLGNYLGAMLPMVELQGSTAGEHQLNMFVPDIHSFTTPIDHSQLYSQILYNLRSFVAAGLDINSEHTYIYRQSHIPALSELTVILNNFSFFGELSRMTQFKDKSSQLQHKSVSVGLFDYPVMMAADILLYGAEWVPVGEDQWQHIEFTRTIGERFNNKFGEIFTLPKPPSQQADFIRLDQGVRIRSLRNPEKKMSKSVEDPSGTILLSDNPDAAAQKIMSATTDSSGSINFDFSAQPGVSNLLQILALLSHQSQAEVTAKWVGKTNYGELKSAVADEVKHFLSDFQQKLENVNEATVIDRLEKDELTMNEVANSMLSKVQTAVGLRPAHTP